MTSNNPPPISSVADLTLTTARVMSAAVDMAAVTKALTVIWVNASMLILMPPVACLGPPPSPGPGTLFLPLPSLRGLHLRLCSCLR